MATHASRYDFSERVTSGLIYTECTTAAYDVTTLDTVDSTPLAAGMRFARTSFVTDEVAVFWFCAVDKETRQTRRQLLKEDSRTTRVGADPRTLSTSFIRSRREDEVETRVPYIDGDADEDVGSRYKSRRNKTNMGTHPTPSFRRDPRRRRRRARAQLRLHR
jgi:hypothetical protein